MLVNRCPADVCGHTMYMDTVYMSTGQRKRSESKYIRTDARTNTPTHTYTHAQPLMHACMHALANTYTRAHRHTHRHTLTHSPAHIHVPTLAHTYTLVWPKQVKVGNAWLHKAALVTRKEISLCEKFWKDWTIFRSRVF